MSSFSLRLLAWTTVQWSGACRLFTRDFTSLVKLLEMVLGSRLYTCGLLGVPGRTGLRSFLGGEAARWRQGGGQGGEQAAQGLHPAGPATL